MKYKNPSLTTVAFLSAYFLFNPLNAVAQESVNSDQQNKSGVEKIINKASEGVQKLRENVPAVDFVIEESAKDFDKVKEKAKQVGEVVKDKYDKASNKYVERMEIMEHKAKKVCSGIKEKIHELTAEDTQEIIETSGATIEQAEDVLDELIRTASEKPSDIVSNYELRKLNLNMVIECVESDIHNELKSVESGLQKENLNEQKLILDLYKSKADLYNRTVTGLKGFFTNTKYVYHKHINNMCDFAEKRIDRKLHKPKDEQFLIKFYNKWREKVCGIDENVSKKEDTINKTFFNLISIQENITESLLFQAFKYQQSLGDKDTDKYQLRQHFLLNSIKIADNGMQIPELFDKVDDLDPDTKHDKIFYKKVDQIEKEIYTIREDIRPIGYIAE